MFRPATACLFLFCLEDGGSRFYLHVDTYRQNKRRHNPHNCILCSISQVKPRNIPLRYILILSSYWLLFLPSGLFPWDLSDTMYAVLICPVSTIRSAHFMPLYWIVLRRDLVLIYYTTTTNFYVLCSIIITILPFLTVSLVQTSFSALISWKVFPSRRGTELHTCPEELQFKRFNLFVYVDRREKNKKLWSERRHFSNLTLFLHSTWMEI